MTENSELEQCQEFVYPAATISQDVTCGRHVDRKERKGRVFI